MSITEVATNNTPPTFVAKPYNRVGENNDDDVLPKVAVKERRVLPNQSQDTPQKQINGVKTSEETWEKRYADLRRHEQNKSKDFQKQIDDLKLELSKKGAKEQLNTLPKTAEEVAAWAEQYKESFDIIKTVAVQETQVQVQALQDQINALQASNEQTSQEKAEAVLTTLVPTWRELNKSMDFHAWLKKDSRKTWADTVYNSSDPYAIAEILETYMTRNKSNEVPVPKQRENDVKAALGVPTNGVPEVDITGNQDGWVKESDVKKLTRKQFEQYEEVIDKARRENRFIYDITGKAQ